MKKAVLTLLAVLLLAGVASASQIDGMVNGVTTLPTTTAEQWEPTTVATLPGGLVMSVNPGGKGDALIYGYYNARDAATFFRVVNTSVTYGVKARVRFREAKRSKEILDFNICLSNKDQWSGWILSPSVSGPAVVQPIDAGFVNLAVKDKDVSPHPQATGKARTLTAPAFGPEAVTAVAFKYNATGPALLADVTADDTKEGYFEILATVAKGIGNETTDVAWTQTECENDQSAVTGNIIQTAPNSLMGNTYIFVMRPTQGVGAFSYNATAIMNCDAIDYGLVNERPNWLDCQGAVRNGLNGLTVVDYILTKTRHYAMYEIEPALSAETEVIINFPTKGLHSHNGDYVYPWDKPFDTTDTTPATSTCEPIFVNIYNDLEDTTTTTTDFSPTGTGQQPVLCNEVNVIKVIQADVAKSSDILNTVVGASVKVDSVTPFTGLGWIRIGLDTGTINCTTGNSTCLGNTAGTTREAMGLPSIGFVLNDYFGLLGGMDSTQYQTSYR